MKIGKKFNHNYFKENFLAIDPGSEGTGLALWLLGKGPYTTKILDYAGHTWEEKCDYICMQLRYEIKQREWLRCIYCEQPQYMSTFKGHTSATSGSLYKLCTLFGRFWEISISLNKKFFPVEIPKWKGQLDKQKVKIRVDNILPGNDYKSHAIDAVGIGLYVKGLF